MVRQGVWKDAREDDERKVKVDVAETDEEEGKEEKKGGRRRRKKKKYSEKKCPLAISIRGEKKVEHF